MSPKNLLGNRKVKTQNHILGSSLLTFPLFHSWVPRLFLGFQLYFPRALGGGFRALPSFPRGLLAVFLKNRFSSYSLDRIFSIGFYNFDSKILGRFLFIEIKNFHSGPCLAHQSSPLASPQVHNRFTSFRKLCSPLIFFFPPGFYN